MSGKIWHDAVNNILHINKEKSHEDTKQAENIELLPQKQQSLRGFIVNIADNEEHAQSIREGKTNEVHFMPLLANSEEEALNFVKSQGKIPLNFNTYEYLKFQVELIENLSLQENIPLQNQSPFEIEKIED